ncbi:IcmT/TraK family protein [Rhizobium wenxiniae]|uniref:IcmT/TraK family protein n=1 Tax=Rhizobium wenxiniae TaxID=1737357 RepID=UPI003C267C11
MTEEDRNIYKERIIWRETIREPRLIGFDARIVIFFLLLAAHLAWWTFGLLCGAAVVFLLVEQAGYRFPSAFRAVRSTFAGNQRPAFFKGNYRKAVDFGFEYRRAWPVRPHQGASIVALDNVESTQTPQGEIRDALPAE